MKEACSLNQAVAVEQETNTSLTINSNLIKHHGLEVGCCVRAGWLPVMALSH